MVTKEGFEQTAVMMSPGVISARAGQFLTEKPASHTGAFQGHGVSNERCCPVAFWEM